uniref:Uncharacterized protein n=1 Tax=Rhizophora mucronata TaxID=61149 RepID=A0A2P2P2T6_RHIMU
MILIMHQKFEEDPFNGIASITKIDIYSAL